MSDRDKEAQAIHSEGLLRIKNEPQPIGQKFDNGSFVMIAKDLGSGMRHFENNCPARVEYTYFHAFPGFGGPDKVKDYSLLVRSDKGEWNSVSWYFEQQLTQITDLEKIAQYEKEIQEDQPRKDLKAAVLRKAEEVVMRHPGDLKAQMKEMGKWVDSVRQKT